MKKYRLEKDSLGTVQVPADAYYGAQTQRARENFPVSGLVLQPLFISALSLVKQCAARVNRELGLLDEKIAAAIEKAAKEVTEKKFTDQFVVDVFQTGSGTSTNMNLNEVISGRANEILTAKKGGKSPVHPNDHVNLGQSSNDVIPTAIHISAMIGIKEQLLPSLEKLHNSLSRKAERFSGVKKLGRTHLQDAVPLTLGQEFSGYARQIRLGIDRIRSVEPRLLELALGGTAVGTGLNAHPEFAPKTIAEICKKTGMEFREAENHFEAQAAQDAAVETSGALKTVAVSLIKIANDLRWLSSGPRCGIGEITLPTLQPGSSIMPGKVNPVIAESVVQVAYQVIGNDTAICLGGQSGNFELNVSLPLIAYNLIQSIELLSTVCELFVRNCIDGIEANEKTCSDYIEKSLALVTNLVPEIGYDRAAELAKKAFETGKTIREIAREEKILSEQTLDELLGI